MTIARFRARHQQALAGFLVASLKLCAAAGMVQVGTVALDGTKLAGNASDKANRTHDKLEAEVAEILQQAAEIDQHEDRLEQAYQQRVAANAKGKKSRQLKRRPQETPNPEATANTTDPDSRFLNTRNGSVQGYNAQAATTMHQLVVAAELTDEANDVHQLQPMLQATATTLAAAGIADRPEAALADSGYWSIANLTSIPNRPSCTSRRPGTVARASRARQARLQRRVEAAVRHPQTCSSCGGTRPPSQRPGRPPPERPPGRVTGGRRQRHRPATRAVAGGSRALGDRYIVVATREPGRQPTPGRRAGRRR